MKWNIKKNVCFNYLLLKCINFVNFDQMHLLLLLILCCFASNVNDELAFRIWQVQTNVVFYHIIRFNVRLTLQHFLIVWVISFRVFLLRRYISISLVHQCFQLTLIHNVTITFQRIYKNLNLDNMFPFTKTNEYLNYMSWTGIIYGMIYYCTLNLISFC